VNKKTVGETEKLGKTGALPAWVKNARGQEVVNIALEKVPREPKERGDTRPEYENANKTGTGAGERGDKFDLRERTLERRVHHLDGIRETGKTATTGGNRGGVGTGKPEETCRATESTGARKKDKRKTKSPAAAVLAHPFNKGEGTGFQG